MMILLGARDQSLRDNLVILVTVIFETMIIFIIIRSDQLRLLMAYCIFTVDVAVVQVILLRLLLRSPPLPARSQLWPLRM